MRHGASKKLAAGPAGAAELAAGAAGEARSGREQVCHRIRGWRAGSNTYGMLHEAGLGPQPGL